MTAITAFVDLSSLRPRDVAGAIAAISRADKLGGTVARAVVYLGAASDATMPPGWTEVADVPPTQACQWAFDTAASADTGVLIVSAGADVGCEAIGGLLEGLDQDPLFGIAIPRLAEHESGRILVTEPFGPRQASVPRGVLASLTDYRVLTESLSPCMLVRREVAANLGWLGDPQQGLWVALAHLSIRARRSGFRTVLCNKVVVRIPAAAASSWGCGPTETSSLREAYPELTQLDGRARGVDARNGELILGAVADAPASLLLDARNLTAVPNGTSNAIVRVCEALYRSRKDSDVGLWVSSEAAVAHDLARRLPEWTLHVATPPHKYAAGLRLSQPWYSSEIESLEYLVGVTVYWILDTIAWDVGYCATEGLDALWQRVARDADGLLFISDFSRDRFETRFSCRPGLTLRTCRLSLEPADYVRPVSTDAPAAPYWFVIGNHYQHKHVGSTVDLLARAFPRQRLLVLGDRSQPRTANVTRFESGRVEEERMSAAFAQADAIIFPSFYEGFGLPILEGLSYGRTVVARASPLVDELAAEYQGPGRLLTFSTERDLIRLLTVLQGGGALEEHPLGRTRTGPSWSWDSTAAEMLATVEALVRVAPSREMLQRTGLSRGLTRSPRTPGGLAKK
jgi:glycosyltransferase involved in cell wall biosynthesis